MLQKLTNENIDDLVRGTTKQICANLITRSRWEKTYKKRDWLKPITITIYPAKEPDCQIDIYTTGKSFLFESGNTDWIVETIQTGGMRVTNKYPDLADAFGALDKLVRNMRLVTKLT